MTRRQQLTEAQIAALFAPPTDQRELVRHYTLSDADMAMIRRCRGDHSRLGYALMLCYLRHPGRPLHVNERPPAALVSFVAEQIDVSPEAFDGYRGSEQNRRRHATELQTDFVVVPSARGPLQSWQAGCSGTPLRMTDWLIWRIWQWRNAVVGASSSHRHGRSSGSASRPVIGRDARSNVG